MPAASTRNIDLSDPMERGAELREKLDLARHATKIAGHLQTHEAVEQLTEAVYRLVECVDILAEGAVDVEIQEQQVSQTR
jgi:hypothetical protein